MLDRLKLLFDSVEKKNASAGPPEFIVAGLGNPGHDYEGTRHNAGFMALDTLAASLNAAVTRIKFKSLCGEAEIAGKRVLLLKPQTFMNLSGEAVHEAAAFYKIPMTRVIVIYDDISLPVGKLRVRPQGTAGGHNGIKNIIYQSGTDIFPRIKIGVGQKPRPDYDLVKWVLGRFPAEQQLTLAEVFDKIPPAVAEIITGGAASAMNKYNG
jgi:peptidyl-tRNA hydrolase, PTH1 family